MSVADLGERGGGGGGGGGRKRSSLHGETERRKKKRLISSLHKIELYTNFIFIIFSRMSHNFHPVYIKINQ